MNAESGSGRHHTPVLLGPVMLGLELKPGGLYMDGTFGRGGHSREILKRLGSAGRLVAIDRDPQAVAAVDPLLERDPRFGIVKGEIANIRQIAAERSLIGKLDGLLLDLGVSSPQLDDPERGFSFRGDGMLDMRMDPTSGQSAAEWLATVGEKELRKVLSGLGEERFAGRIAKAIVAARAAKPIRRTSELADIVAAAVPVRGQHKHPATKTFQAIRIRINDELRQLEQALEASGGLLAPGGRLCVISFHSLEDRRVKRFMRNASREAEAYRGLPSIPEDQRATFRLIGKAQKASDDEVSANPRARSARLRIAERV
ncbi:MAG TPA: 16S rRNA (cytosine(1402)-N(4))-methyltransferase RsmH [Woeseiaceae bacterium]|nr:16S rRNA (cytosine(1402)-N(4))-methyltransferase RsmH [Woeseiaceae bacterium]